MPFLNRSEVAEMLQLSERAIGSLVKAGKLPAPVQFGPHTARWSQEDLLRHIDGLKRTQAAEVALGDAPEPALS